MPFAPVVKDLASARVRPNLVDYDRERADFTWEAARARLDGLPDGDGLNIAHEAVDRHLGTPVEDKVAIRWLGRHDERVELTYADLAAATNRFANVLDTLGVGAGERVFALAPRVPDLYVAVLGTLKHGSVLSPLFAAFGPEPIAQRLQLGTGRVLVTTSSLYRKKVAAQRDRLPSLAHVLLVDGGADAFGDATVHDLAPLLAAASPDYRIPPTDPEAMALLHFTSGTTGTPKGAVHVHDAVVAHHMTGYYALDLHPDDVFWCTADPGWVTGISYGVVAPLTHGVTMVVDEADFDAERWYRILDEEQVSVWYTAPTAIRMLMRVGTAIVSEYDLSALRFIASVGEPLNPEAVVWGQQTYGLPIHDNWWQTETGGIMVANFAATDIRPGSMGRPLPGIEVAVVERHRDGDDITTGVTVIDAPDVEGELALKPGWPSMFRGYLDMDERYREAFVDGWYLSGDLVRRDADGYLWFVGRADNVIKTAGHLIGPFEVESALMEHPAVAEVGVIGKPDEVAGQIIKAFVALNPEWAASDELRRELIGHARKLLGAAVAPREIAFAHDLPKTRSGKIMRRLLKARELGLPEGDTSTLEGGGS